MCIKRIKLFYALLSFVALLSCGKQTKPPEWTYSDEEVTGTKPAKADQIELDVYIDATTSMQGFATNTESVFGQFLDQLEASALAAWKNANTSYYKFGEIVKPIQRQEFLSAKNDPRFYQEKGIFMKTYIDSVVARTNPDRLSVLITDLFQDEGDVNIMVDRIKQKCFARGVLVGFLGIQSSFSGKVYDVKGFPSGFSLESSNRPFYAIMFGNPYNMELLLNALKSKPFVKEENIMLFSTHIVKSQTVTSLSKTRDSKTITNKKARNEMRNAFEFGMKEGKEQARIDFAIDIARNLRCPDFKASELELVVFKKSAKEGTAASGDSITSNDIVVKTIERSGDKLTGVLRVDNSDPVGIYSYQLQFKTNPLTGLANAAWIDTFSTDNPIPNTPSASKTYNLKKLTSTLLVANATVNPVYVSKFYITFYKR